MSNQLIILIMLSFGILIVSLIIMIKVFIEQLKKETNESIIFLFLIGTVIIFLTPVILGMMQEIL